MKEKISGISLYVHFPFCIKKCLYCDFASVPAEKTYIELYLNCLEREIDIFANKHLVNGAKLRVRTLYFGGGTPSLMGPEEISRLLNQLSKYFIMDRLEEATIEANPETVEESKFEHFLKIGISRVSLGAQSFNDRTLRLLGRVHNAKKIYSAYFKLRKAGYKNVNLDLMHSLPDEDSDSALDSLGEAIKLQPEHISYYSLTLERKTPLYKLRANYTFPDEEKSLKQYRDGIRLLAANGYRQYEVSNFARQGFECKHNISYWLSLPYIGFGVSAGSFVARKRFINTSSLETYFKRIQSNKLPTSFVERITGKKEKGEYIMMALRMRKGFKIDEYYDRFGSLPETDFARDLEFLSKYGLLKVNRNNIRITAKGLFLLNRVLERFI